MRLRLEDHWPPETVRVARLIGDLAAQCGVAAYLVGGPVRDLLRGQDTLDLDVAVEGEVAPLAAALAERLGGQVTAHDRFGTATVSWDGPLHIDLARTRRETYPAPGGLPLVEPASLAEDLSRRDFTIQAMALRLDQGRGEVLDPEGGRLDLALGLLRGLHPRTFVDDPTRLLRAARYAAQLDLQVEPATLAWLRTAVADGALGTVSGARVWGELQRLLGSPTAATGCGLLVSWGATEALGWVHPDRVAWLAGLAEAARLLDLAEGAEAAVLAALGLLAGMAAGDRWRSYGLTSDQRQAVAAAARMAAQPPALAFAAEAKSSKLYAELSPLPLAALLAGWLAFPVARPALERARRLRETRADVTGGDLQAAGYPPGPGYRQALQAALAAKLDQAASPEQQLLVARAVLDDAAHR